jgi:hypothetical protein
MNKSTIFFRFCLSLIITFFFRCEMHFDFSDHIVLYMVQYIFPTLLEMDYLIANKFLSYPMTVGGGSSPNGSVKDPIFSWKNIFLLPLLCSVLFILVNFRLALSTTLFFHTPMENIVGFLLAYIFSFSLLLSNRFVNFWINLTR